MDFCLKEEGEQVEEKEEENKILLSIQKNSNYIFLKFKREKKNIAWVLVSIRPISFC